MNDKVMQAARNGVLNVIRKTNHHADVAEDLTQETLLRLIHLRDVEIIQTYEDYAYGVGQHVAREFLNTQSGATVIPRHAGEWRSRLAGAEIRLAQRLMREPTQAEIAEEMGEDLETFHAKRGLVHQQALEVDGFDPAEDADDLQQDLLAGEGDDPVDLLADAEARALLWEGLYRLPDQARDIVCLYFGLGYGRDNPLRDVEAITGIPRTTCARILSESLAHLRRSSNEVR